MKRFMVYSCMALTGCSSANLHWSETPAWASDLTYSQFCTQSAITPPESDKGRLLLNELRRRQERTPFNVEDCAALGANKARELAEYKAKTDAFFRGVGTVIGVGLAVGVVGAAGYYGGARSSRPLVIAQSPPAPPPVPYTPPLPITFPLLTQTVNQAFTQKVCTYGGTSTVIVVQPYQSCPASVPQ